MKILFAANKKIASIKSAPLFEDDYKKNTLKSRTISRIQSMGRKIGSSLIIINSRNEKQIFYKLKRSFLEISKTKFLYIVNEFTNLNLDAESFEILNEETLIKIIKELQKIKKDFSELVDKFSQKYKQINFYEGKKENISRNRFKKGLLSLDKNKNVISVKKENDYSIINFSNGSIIKAKHSKNTINLLGKSKEGLENKMYAISNIKETVTIFNDEFKSLKIEKFSFKKFLKYSIMLALIILIFWFVFKIVYKDSKGGIFEGAKNFASIKPYYFWLLILAFAFFNISFSALIIKRITMKMGQKVQIRHIATASIMSSIISYITPLTIGGDAIGYWYLRRKGVKAGPLASAYMINTILYQFRLILQTAILLPIGFNLYYDIFSNQNPEMKAAFSFFIIGMSWDLFSGLMIGMLVMWKGFQEACVNALLKFLIWFPIVHIKKIEHKAGNFYHEFYSMRKSFKTIIKSPLIVLELIVYQFIIIFYNQQAILIGSSGWVRKDLGINPYIAYLITNDITSTANSFSFLPGGSGTGEWLNIQIKNYVYNTTANNSVFTDGKILASSMDFFWKLLFSWPMQIMSLFMIIQVTIEEMFFKNSTNKSKLIVFRLSKLFFWIILLGLYILLLTIFIL